MYLSHRNTWISNDPVGKINKIKQAVSISRNLGSGKGSCILTAINKQENIVALVKSRRQDSTQQIHRERAKSIGRKTRYIYFFRGSLKTHVHLYKGWVDVARRDGLSMHLLTILDLRAYLSEWRLVRQLSSIHYFRVLFCLPKTSPIVTFAYFLLIALASEQVVVHLRKRTPVPFDFLKKLLGKKIRYIIELEGDYESERDFLLQHPYKQGFYDSHIASMKYEASQLGRKLNRADHVLVVSPKLRTLLVNRFPELCLQQKVSVVPTGVDCNKCFFSQDMRDATRASLDIQDDQFVMIYAGNAFYSWQNVARTIEIFRLIKHQLADKAYLILLIRHADHAIVEELIERVGLAGSEYLLTSVAHDEVPRYLNAADMGVLLRHRHVMNEVTSPGKFGEYAACGLPILMTEGISDFSARLAQTDYGVVLKDMDNDDEVLRRVAPFFRYDEEKRMRISRWGREQFSTEAYASAYVGVLQRAQSS